MGIKRVRPLCGGFAEWKRRGYVLEDAIEQIGWGKAATSASPA
jgi:3-mercaptopyruvate sulfurtransferase SseA